MTEDFRKLASVRVVRDIRPIPDADAIECITVDGWELVAQKGIYSPGELVCYFEINSLLPILEPYEFLRKSSYRQLPGFYEGFRIKTIKLRGQISQGLLMPLRELVPGPGKTLDDLYDVLSQVEEGADLTDVLGVVKWDPTLGKALSGDAKGPFPYQIAKTDQERVQNSYYAMKNRYGGDLKFEATLKLDGTSATYFLLDGVFGVCSRNQELKEGDSVYWKIARKYEIEEKLRTAGLDNYAIQGEIMGPGVQGNRENLKEHTLFIFDVFVVAEGKHLSPDARYVALDRLGLLNLHVPLVERECQPLKLTLKEILEYAERPSITHPIAEGVVFKALDGSITFKAISNKFLLKEKD